jgi:hypothetical protein
VCNEKAHLESTVLETGVRTMSTEYRLCEGRVVCRE